MLSSSYKKNSFLCLLIFTYLIIFANSRFVPIFDTEDGTSQAGLPGISKNSLFSSECIMMLENTSPPLEQIDWQV